MCNIFGSGVYTDYCIGPVFMSEYSINRDLNTNIGGEICFNLYCDILLAFLILLHYISQAVIIIYKENWVLVKRTEPNKFFVPSKILLRFHWVYNYCSWNTFGNKEARKLWNTEWIQYFETPYSNIGFVHFWTPHTE